jgi:thiopurine S-methyltransferase
MLKMEADFWINKWINNDIGFHQEKFHPQLEKYSYLLGHNILVPLCGKTLDMIYLASQGHKVIGVELSPVACKSFFLENKISYTEKKIDDFIVYESNSITLWCGDFFKLPQDVWENVTSIYDRAALIALPPDMRQRYGEAIAKNTSEILRILLIAVEYPEGALQGPPFSVSEEEILTIYHEFFAQRIHSQLLQRPSRVDPHKMIEFTESVYWLSKAGRQQ